MSKRHETNNQAVNDRVEDLPEWKKDQYKSVMSDEEKKRLDIATDEGLPTNPLDYDHNPIAKENAMLTFDGKQVPPDQSPIDVPDWKDRKWNREHGIDEAAVVVTREVLPVSEDIILNEDGTVANVPENIGKIAPVGRVLVVGDRTFNHVLDPAKSPYQAKEPALSPAPGEPGVKDNFDGES